MANPVIWSGTSTFTPGSTPFGFYDTDIDFTADADDSASLTTKLRISYS